jgi:hypothetical protein
MKHMGALQRVPSGPATAAHRQAWKLTLIAGALLLMAALSLIMMAASMVPLDTLGDMISHSNGAGSAPDTLVLYIYSDTDPEYAKNMQVCGLARPLRAARCRALLHQRPLQASSM